MSSLPEFDFRTFLEAVPYVIDKKMPILMRGRHGIGKSELARQIAREVVKLPIVELRLSQMDTGDLLGLPYDEGDRTVFKPMNWFKTVCDYPCVLFIDEIDRAIKELRQGVFQLTDSRMLNGNKIHEDTVIIGACNSGVHGELYDVGQMDPAELSRWSVWDLSPSVQDWIAWARRDNRIILNIVDFIASNPEHLEYKNEYIFDKIHPTRRSWKRLSDVLLHYDFSDIDSSLFAIANSFVGVEASSAFEEFVQHRKEHVTIDELLDGVVFGIIENYGAVQHSNLIDRLEENECLKYNLRKDKCENIAEYTRYLNNELLLKFYHILMSSNEQVIKYIFNYKKDKNRSWFGNRVADAINGA